MDIRKGYCIRTMVIITIAVMVLTLTGTGPVYSADRPKVAVVEHDKFLVDVNDRRYAMNQNGSTLFYLMDGTTHVKKVTGKDRIERKHIVLKDPKTGKEREGYCVEFNAKVEGGMSYDSYYADDAAYFVNMPEDVKTLLRAVTYYGHNGRNRLPVKGVRGHDFYFATQILIWEVQQQLRVLKRDREGHLTGTELVNAHGMSRDFFYKAVKGRSAEKCYDYIAGCLDRHFDLPPFVGDTRSRAEPIELKYCTDGKWRASVSQGRTDLDISWNDEVISYSEHNGVHSFSAEALPDGFRTVRVSRKAGTGSAADDLLIWNASDRTKQVLSTGSSTPPQFFMRFRMDEPSGITIRKTDEGTGKTVPVEGTAYRIKDLSDGKDVYDETYVTGKDGTVDTGRKFPQGRYVLEEVKAPKGYVRDRDGLDFTVDGEGEDIDLVHGNIPQTGVITITKTGEYIEDEEIRKKALEGIEFDIVALGDVVTADGTVRAEKGEVVDTIRTDPGGNVSSCPLHLGAYSIVEKNAPAMYRECAPVNVALVYTSQDEVTIEKKVDILNRLREAGDAMSGMPRTGDDGGMSAFLLTGLSAFTVIVVIFIASRIRRI